MLVLITNSEVIGGCQTEDRRPSDRSTEGRGRPVLHPTRPNPILIRAFPWKSRGSRLFSVIPFPVSRLQFCNQDLETSVTNYIDIAGLAHVVNRSIALNTDFAIQPFPFKPPGKDITTTGMQNSPRFRL